MRPDPDKSYYTAYDKRYREVYKQGVPHWTANPSDLKSIVLTIDGFLAHHRISADVSIAEFGCGEGFVSVYLLAQGYAYTGIDISPAAIEKATERIVSYGDRGLLLCTDLLNITSFTEETYDVGIDVGCLEMFVTDSDRQLYLNNLYRMLKPGAPLLFCRAAFDPDAIEDYIDTYDNWLTIAKQDVDMPELRNAYKDGTPYPIQLPNIAVRPRNLVHYEQELEHAGFEFLKGRISSTGVQATFEVRKPDPEDDDDLYEDY
ncbi:MAG: class I SAM-dependent methyltransferase [Candidatus Latescibacteria bacterium]|jgi:SAM-dependent methyltransferase|nr:class I SAM-dependent methyltransferase [Candidatus Latescibacterota bacterium]MBT4139044.1 class I SAM-dependent methyltransferase [Candidatus Latescibacterota bacterium]